MSTAASARSSTSGPGAAGESKGQRTRRRILTAARAVFAEVGYERATIRAIAIAADADKSSIIKYFGTKEALFREAVQWKIPIAEFVSGSTVATEELARTMLGAWASDPNGPMIVLLRTSMTSEVAAEILRDHVTEHAVDALAKTIDGPDSRLKAAVAGAMLMGIAAQRYILRMPDLADANIDDILDLVAPLLQDLIGPDTNSN